MSDPTYKFNVFTLEPKPGSIASGREDVPASELPPELAGYTRQPQDWIVTATGESDVIVGMGGAWLYRHPEKPPMLWVKAAEVNGPFKNKGLERQLLDALLTVAREGGIPGAYFAEHVRKHLAH